VVLLAHAGAVTGFGLELERGLEVVDVEPRSAVELRRAALNLLKYLANDLKLSLVVVGTADAPLALESDAQMRSRFTPLEIPRWRESDDFRRLLRAFESVLPMRKPSDLSQRPIAQFLLAASAGLLGEVARMLTETAELAIRDGSECITLAHLEGVAHAVA
jgi:hypothetical protein